MVDTVGNKRWRKVILHRFLTENGGVVFALGTRFGGTVTRDKEDVPLSDIYHHITPAELQRFENTDYAEEHERERIRLLTLKPKGRPRNHALPNGVGHIQNPTNSPLGYTAFRAMATEGEVKNKRGRPKGWRKYPAVLTNGHVPSFSGPQPTGKESISAVASTRAQSTEPETPLEMQARTGVYSMVAASGIIPDRSDSEVESSRNVTPLPGNHETSYDHWSKPMRIDETAFDPYKPVLEGPNSSVVASTEPLVDDTVGEEHIAAWKEIRDSDAERETSLDQFISDGSQLGPFSISCNDSRPQPTQPSLTTSQAPQPTPAKMPQKRRTSITPLFPGCRSTIPRLDGVNKRASISPAALRKREPKQHAVISPRFHLSNHQNGPVPALLEETRPSAGISMGSLGPKQKDIASYFRGAVTSSRQSPTRQVVPQDRAFLQAHSSGAVQQLGPTQASSTFARSWINLPSQAPPAKGPLGQSISTGSEYEESEDEYAEPSQGIMTNDSRASPKSYSSAVGRVSRFDSVIQPVATNSPRRRTSIADSIDPRLKGIRGIEEDTRSENEDHEEMQTLDMVAGISAVPAIHDNIRDDHGDTSHDASDIVTQISIDVRSR
ncbi:MAG: hypothetical protein Q9163_003873 [Psora crenata]